MEEYFYEIDGLYSSRPRVFLDPRSKQCCKTSSKTGASNNEFLFFKYFIQAFAEKMCIK